MDFHALTSGQAMPVSWEKTDILVVEPSAELTAAPSWVTYVVN